MRPRWRTAAEVGALVCSVVVGLPAHGGEPAATAGEWREFQRIVQPFLARHCLECHGAKRSGDVRLDTFHDETALARGVPILDQALAMLRKQAMPPKRRPQPGGDEVK